MEIKKRMLKKIRKRINKHEEDELESTLFEKIWFYLTCLRPVTKYEMYDLKRTLLVILEGMRDSDLQHYQTERILLEQIKKLTEGNIKRDDNKKGNGGIMFS